MLDVGSGSGIPGIALAILHPNQHLVIVEANTKKINFLTTVKKELHLNNVQLLNERAECISNMYKNYFDLTTARAVAKIKVILELTIPYSKVNGTCILLKGEN
ncbi:16S rRNA (guanine(527)-N(7))-methyltransferase RsmG [bacterium]|nr:16S rRNA (guanine(527)-N(7))-methyltransferase RsmG [bacterium]